METTYSKPKVTIDLDEYNDLFKKIKSISESEFSKKENAYKEVIWMFLKSGGDFPMAIKRLEENGVIVFLPSFYGINNEPYKLIEIKINEKSITNKT